MAKFIDPTSRVQNLRYANAWSFLEERERNYAYWMSKASWAGAKMVPHQISYESPVLLMVFGAYFACKDFEALEKSVTDLVAALPAEEAAAEAALTESTGNSTWKRFMAYVGGFYGNLSNYHSFGALKFVPHMHPPVFKKILCAHPQFEQPEGSNLKNLMDLFNLIETEVFAYDKPYTQLNFPEDGGITAYFGRNITKDDLKLINEFLAEQKIDVLNTRAFKHKDTFFITVGCIDQGESAHIFKDREFVVKKGEFAPYLEEMNGYLEQALKYVANDTQKKMVELYIESYKNGSIEVHKDSQRQWIRDKGPIVETNQGWIETYIDPSGSRAYYEAWVSIVDKEKSKKFQQLVKNSEHIIPLLPWPKEQEKENFMAPDFTTLEIICFATNGCPLGINVPNYDDVREEEGFKNVFLNNSLGSYVASQVEFATQEQSDILGKYTLKCYEVHVACHELLGHGVGKLIYRESEDAPMPSFVDPISGDTIESCYGPTEVWTTKFGAIATSYEECRADTCGYYLCTLPEVYTLFGIQEDEVQTMLWCNVMNQLRKGVLGLTLYNAETKKWGQAHTQGAWVITQFIYQNQKSEIIRFELNEDKDEFFIHLDSDLLMGEGRELIKKLLLILQAYKSYGQVEMGTKWYNHLSQVDDFFLKVRDLVIKKKKPRRVEVNNNLVLVSESQIDVVEYPETFEGIVRSYADRYPCTEQMVAEIRDQWTWKIGETTIAEQLSVTPHEEKMK